MEQKMKNTIRNKKWRMLRKYLEYCAAIYIFGFYVNFMTFDGLFSTYRMCHFEKNGEIDYSDVQSAIDDIYRAKLLGHAKIQEYTFVWPFYSPFKAWPFNTDRDTTNSIASIDEYLCLNKLDFPAFVKRNHLLRERLIPKGYREYIDFGDEKTRIPFNYTTLFLFWLAIWLPYMITHYPILFDFIPVLVLCYIFRRTFKFYAGVESRRPLLQPCQKAGAGHVTPPPIPQQPDTPPNTPDDNAPAADT